MGTEVPFTRRPGHGPRPAIGPHGETGARPAFEVERLKVRRGPSFTLEIPRLSVTVGRTLAVLGLNGAGKSTLLEVLALLLPPDEGVLRVFGKSTWPGDADLVLRRRLGLALQDPLLLAGSVLDNVTLPLRLRGLPRVEGRERALASLERLDVAHLAHRPARSTSGGEARRISLARALVTGPELLLLDEPFSALDPPTHDALMQDFQRALDPATAVVLVTHDRFEALNLADEVAVVHQGRLKQWGPAREVFERPVDASVAALVGGAA